MRGSNKPMETRTAENIIRFDEPSCWTRFAQSTQNCCYQFMAATCLWDCIIVGFRPGREYAINLLEIHPTDIVLFDWRRRGSWFWLSSIFLHKWCAMPKNPHESLLFQKKMFFKAMPKLFLPFTKKRYCIYALQEAERVLAPGGLLCLRKWWMVGIDLRLDDSVRGVLRNAPLPISIVTWARWWAAKNTHRLKSLNIIRWVGAWMVALLAVWTRCIESRCWSEKLIILIHIRPAPTWANDKYSYWTDFVCPGLSETEWVGRDECSNSNENNNQVPRADAWAASTYTVVRRPCPFAVAAGGWYMHWKQNEGGGDRDRTI
jgi:hypothetical protein